MNKTAFLLTLVMLLSLLRPGLSEGGDAVSPEEAERVLARAFSRGADIYKKYRGIESLRKEVLREYDPETGALRSTSEVTSRRREYYYALPEIEVITYKKDGKEMEPSKFKVWKAMPIYPVFDEKGREHYTVTIPDRKTIGGRECYRFQVEPKENTARHFRGNIYVTVKTLDMVAIEGTMAKLDFPLREFRLALNLVQQGDVPVAKNGTVRLRVKVPVFFPDTIIESAFDVLQNRLIE